MWWLPRRRQTEQPKDSRLTERELVEFEEHLRHSLQTFVRKLRFIDMETRWIFEDEDKRALANDGIDALVTEFTDYMRTRVKPDGTEH